MKWLNPFKKCICCNEKAKKATTDLLDGQVLLYEAVANGSIIVDSKVRHKIINPFTGGFKIYPLCEHCYSILSKAERIKFEEHQKEFLLQRVQDEYYKKTYILRQTSSSYCPKCQKPLQLLHDPNDLTNPQFYICFEDKFNGQVGVGEVLLSDSVHLIVGGTFSGRTTQHILKK